MVHELKPNIDWDKSKAVRRRRVRDVGRPRNRDLVRRADDPEVGDRHAAAQFVLGRVDEVKRFLTNLGR